MSTDNREPSQPLLSADQFVPGVRIGQGQPDLEAPGIHLSPQTVVINVIPPATAPLAEQPEPVDAAEKLKLERAILLVPLAFVAHSTATYSVIDYLLSRHHGYASIQLVFDVYLAISLLISFSFSAYLRCHASEVRSQIAVILSRCDFTSWTLFLFLQITFGLVMSTFSVFYSSRALMFLVCGLVISLLAAAGGLAHKPLIIPRPSFASNDVAPRAYAGLFFPLLLYEIAYLSTDENFNKRDTAMLVCALVISALGATSTIVKCTQFGNSVIVYLTMFTITVIATFAFRT